MDGGGKFPEYSQARVDAAKRWMDLVDATRRGAMTRIVKISGHAGRLTRPWLRLLILVCLGLPVGPLSGQPADSGRVYLWRPAAPEADSIANRIAVPAGYERVALAPGSFGDWLRHLPLKAAGAAVHLYDGRLKPNQAAHCAVIDLDVGRRDLQQCADAVIRLRAEYLFSQGRAGEVVFRLTNGEPCPFARWAGGERPRIVNNRIRWERDAGVNRSHPSLRRYLDFVFAYAGTLSLERELAPGDFRQGPAPGDVFILGGRPGHAVLVVDAAVPRSGGPALFLLAQSYMPAQEMHVLVNPTDPGLSPWYRATPGARLETPEWVFEPGQLKRFK